MSVYDDTMYEEKIIEYRNTLDELDKVIIEALLNRFKITDQIGALKKEHKMPIFDSSREQKILRNIESMIYDKSNTDSIIAVYKEIMAQSRLRQGDL